MADRIIFACDYEDTYSREKGKHPDEKEVDAVRKFRRAGNLFGIVMERDAFEAMANIGEYEEEYDFIACSTGACLIARLPVEAGKFGAPIRIATDTANQYFLGELYDLFASVGADRFAIDVLGFKGGDGEGERFGREYVPVNGMSCWVHYWGGEGRYRVFPVNRNALPFVTPFSQCRATFKNAVTADGVAGEVNRRYNGWLRAYVSDKDAVVLPSESNKAVAVRRFAELAGASLDKVWAFGNGTEDACMLREFNGIATTDGCTQAMAATGLKAKTVAEALEIVLSI